MVTEKRTGHLAALLTILIWGTTFISTKNLTCRLSVRFVAFYGYEKSAQYITVIMSMPVLKETVTFLSITGTILAVAGLFLSEYNRTGSKKIENWKFSIPSLCLRGIHKLAMRKKTRRNGVKDE